MEEVNADREAHGKRSFDNVKLPIPPEKQRGNTSRKKLSRWKKDKTRIATKSKTDPDCGLFVKGSHERQFAYKVHTTCGENGLVLETVVTSGAVRDSVAFSEAYDKVTKAFPETETPLPLLPTRRPIFARKYLMTAEPYP